MSKKRVGLPEPYSKAKILRTQSRHQLLSLFLVFMFFVNNSYALEIVIHDAHQHAESAAMHSGDDIADAQMETAGQLKLHDTGHSANELDADEDCLCDEICCLSSVDMGMPVLANNSVPDDPGKAIDLSLYKSISLDLLLPPPTS